MTRLHCVCHMGQGYPDIFPCEPPGAGENVPGVCWPITQPSNHVKFHKLPWLDGHLVGSFRSPKRDLQLVSFYPEHHSISQKGNRAVRLHCKLAPTWDP